MALTEVAIKHFKPASKDQKVSDEKGLYLLVKANGSRHWRMKYRIGGEEKTLELGVYPEVSMKAARLGRDKARLELAKGIDPSQLKQTRKDLLKQEQSNSFQAVATEWYTRNKAHWTSSTADKQLWILEKNLF